MLASKEILLLEDDIVDVMTIQRALKQLNITNTCIVKTNGEEGLEYLRNCEELPGLIFLDINMPKMNGIEFLKLMKQNDNWSRIPVIVLTTSNDQRDKDETFKFGISGYMIKPVGYDDFKEMLSAIQTYWNISEHPY